MFEKGVSGNPNGRPKRKDEIISRLSPNSERFVSNIIAIANGEIEDAKVSDMLKANELALAYLYGKPTQAIDATVTDNNRRIDTSKLTTEEREALAKVAVLNMNLATEDEPEESE